MTLNETALDIMAVLTNAGLKASNGVPRQIIPPTALVQFAGLNNEGVSFGEVNTLWTVTVVAPAGTNIVGTTGLLDLIEDAVVALIQSKYIVASVQEPGVVNSGVTELPGAIINISRCIAL